jgi:hypothetical protein
MARVTGLESAMGTLLWIEIVFPRLVHDAKEAAGSGIPIWNSFIQPTHEE